MNALSQIEKANKPNELLDLVNDKDEIIGEVIREKANTNPELTHREVAVILVDDQDRILLQKRSRYKSVNPGMWSVTAGHILKGEAPLATAHTELQEELGFDTELVFLTKVLHTYDWETHFMYYYLGKYSGEKMFVETAEVETTHFFTEKELEAYIKNGESVNTKHTEIFKEFWQGKYKKEVATLGL